MSSFRTREEPDGLVIMLDDAAGLNDFRSSAFRDMLYELVEALESPRVAFNLSKVDYLSSSGVAILVGLKRRIDTKKGKLVLFATQPIVFDLLRIMKLTQYFTFADDECRHWRPFVRSPRCNPSYSFPRHPCLPTLSARLKSSSEDRRVNKP